METYQIKPFGIVSNEFNEPVKAAFASRSPRRPNTIGVTTVKLQKYDKNEGDTINNTPVIDIKYCDTSLFVSETESNAVHNSILKSDPRIEIRNNIAGGKMAFTHTKRDGKGIRICSCHESRDVIETAFPCFQQYYQSVVVNQNHDNELVSVYKKIALQRAFVTLKIPFNKLFTINHIQVEILEYAPIYKSIICSVCGESVMASRIVKLQSANLCIDCVQICANYLTGNGITCSVNP